jgi:outer membrane protein TolC
MLVKPSTSTGEHQMKPSLTSSRLALLVLVISPTSSPAAPEKPGDGEPAIRLSASEAVARALRHNLDLAYEKLAPELSDAPERAAAASYDLLLSSELEVSGSPGQVSLQRAGLSPISSTSVGGDVGLSRKISTGTSLELSFSSTGLFGGGGSKGLDPAYQSGLRLTARQSLLNGVSRQANLLPITSARLRRALATKDLARAAELVGAATLKAYWSLHAALSKLAIQKIALQMTQRTLQETQVLINAGRLAPSEEVAAAYAVKASQRDLVLMEKAVSDARDKLARLMGTVPPSSMATPPLVTYIGPRPTPWRVTRKELQELALKRRGDYLALLEQQKLYRAEVQATRHQRLPTLDLVAGLSLTGLSGTDESGDYTAGYWSSYKMDRVGWSAGLVLDLPIFNHKARADADLAELKLRRAGLVIERAQQELSEELNVTWRAVEAARRQFALTKAAAKAAEVKLANEEALYKAGKVTAHILATVQAEVVKERLAKEQALADLISARVDMYASAGVLLQRVEQLQRRR